MPTAPKIKREKTKILLKWDAEKGKHAMFFLNPAVKTKKRNEEHYFAGQFIGYLGEKK